MAADLPSTDTALSPISGYQIVQRIGNGEMGAVYLAIDNKKNRKVALKLFSVQETERQPQILERFNAEVQHGKRIRDENLSRFYRFGRQGDLCYVAAEFVDGVKLDDYVKERSRLSNLQALDFIMQATRAIQHLDNSGIVHRDIKPSNFLVTRQGDKDRTKLIDLGVNERTISADRIGCMSPEQARDRNTLDTRSNIYSLGCMWYHLLAGHAPFDEGTASERLQKHIAENPTPISEINPDVTVGCLRILSRMMAKDPLQRYSALSELLADLRKESAVWQLTDPTVAAKPASDAVPESAGLVGRSIRMKKGRRHFTSLEDERGKASSPLFDRRKRKKLPLLINACRQWLRRLFG
jgi:eukaryotic-like serine/threonine-protein kinase